MNARTFIVFDLRVFSLLILKKAAYRFGGKYRVQIRLLDEHNAEVELYPRLTLSDSLIPDVSADFSAAVVDEDLRSQIYQQTEGIRNLIIAHAFSRTSLLDPDGEYAHHEDDPLLIGVARGAQESE